MWQNGWTELQSCFFAVSSSAFQSISVADCTLIFLSNHISWMLHLIAEQCFKSKVKQSIYQNKTHIINDATLRKTVFVEVIQSFFKEVMITFYWTESLRWWREWIQHPAGSGCAGRKTWQPEEIKEWNRWTDAASFNTSLESVAGLKSAVCSYMGMTVTLCNITSC